MASKFIGAWACYVTEPNVGWIVDTCAGGRYSFDVEDAKEWPTRDDVRPELEACDLVYSDKYVVEIDTGEFVPVINGYTVVRIR